MAKVKVVLEVDIETLRKVREENIGEEDAKNESLEEAISQELGWVNQSGISVDSIQEVDPDESIINSLREITCPNDGKESNKEIIEFLRGADEKTLDEQAHGFEFKDKNGNVIEIIMWENCDHFSLRTLAEHIGVI